MNVLLVTGSRSLWHNREAERAVSYIFADFNPLNIGLVVTGDAAGPDDWAQLEARTDSIPFERWQLDGCVIDSKSEHGSRRWYSEAGSCVDRRRLPLERNKAMVQSVAFGALFGDNVLCVGFVDPRSRTRGTDHTLRLARQAGIWCARYVWHGTEFVEGS